MPKYLPEPRFWAQAKAIWTERTAEQARWDIKSGQTSYKAIICALDILHNTPLADHKIAHLCHTIVVSQQYARQRNKIAAQSRSIESNSKCPENTASRSRLPMEILKLCALDIGSTKAVFLLSHLNVPMQVVLQLHSWNPVLASVSFAFASPHE